MNSVVPLRPVHSNYFLTSNIFSKHRRHKKLQKDNIRSALNKPTVRRLARRGGVKRINTNIYSEAQIAVHDFLKQVIRNATTVVEYARRKTMTAHDVVYALKLMGTPLYGFGEKEPFDNSERLKASRERRDRIRWDKERIDLEARVERGLRDMGVAG